MPHWGVEMFSTSSWSSNLFGLFLRSLLLRFLCWCGAGGCYSPVTILDSQDNPLPPYWAVLGAGRSVQSAMTFRQTAKTIYRQQISLTVTSEGLDHPIRELKQYPATYSPPGAISTALSFVAVHNKLPRHKLQTQAGAWDNKWIGANLSNSSWTTHGRGGNEINQINYLLSSGRKCQTFHNEAFGSRIAVPGSI